MVEGDSQDTESFDTRMAFYGDGRAMRMPQLVGRDCARCWERIPSEIDGRFCRKCGSPVHDRCAHPVGDSECPECGVTPRRIEDARRRFARSLVGYWITAQGTFNQVMAQHWEVCPDGTGRFTDRGPFGYPRAETCFEWRQAGDFTIELRLTKCVAHEPNFEAELDSDDSEWQTIRYGFVAVQTDCGFEVGLVGGILSINAPLGYSGPVNVQDSSQGHAT